MLQNLARAIVRRYPAAWRERYADEVLDLLDTAPLRLFDVGELFRNMLVEQVRSAIETNEPSVAFARVTRYKIAAVVVSAALTQVAGRLLWWWRPLNESEFERVLLVAMAFWFTLLLIWAVHTWRQRDLLRDDRAPFPVWLALACLPLHLVAATAWLWSGLSGAEFSSTPAMSAFMTHYHSLYLQGIVSTWLLIQIWPGQRLVRMLGEFKMADDAVNAAQGWVRSCEEWIDKGVMSPLSDAKAALEQRIRERDAVHERMNGVSQRARSRPPS